MKSSIIIGIMLILSTSYLHSRELKKSKQIRPSVKVKKNSSALPVESGVDKFGIPYKRIVQEVKGGLKITILSDPKKLGKMTSKIEVIELDEPFVKVVTKYELKGSTWKKIKRTQQDRKANISGDKK